MKKFVVNGTVISEEVAKKLDEINAELINLASETGDITYLVGATVILPYDLAMELAAKKGA